MHPVLVGQFLLMGHGGHVGGDGPALAVLVARVFLLWGHLTTLSRSRSE